MTEEPDEITREFVIGLTGGIGVDFSDVKGALKVKFEEIPNTIVHEIKLSELIRKILPTPEEEPDPKNKNEPERIKFFMDEASKFRMDCKKNSLLAILAMNEIRKFRKEQNTEQDKGNDQKKKAKYIIHILDSLKRPEEAELLRNVYGRNFILIGISTSKEKRIENIKQKTSPEKIDKKLTEEIESLIEKDYSETEEEHKRCGQNVLKTFPEAHFFVDTESNFCKEIKRFVDILFGHPFITPSIDERGMFAAKGISLRSADPSRQVGAVITNKHGDIIASGCNEVPKFGGGFYEPGDENDYRDFQNKAPQNKGSQRAKDTNVEEKMEILYDLVKKLMILEDFRDKTKLYNRLDEAGSKFTDLLEFGRAVHAELAAICDAAQRGVSVKDATLYCTTFPCHLCIKHILAVGIKRVVYIYPYPKSKAELHFEKSITNDKKKAENGNELLLVPFFGVSPRRFLHVFRDNKGRKEDKLHLKPARRTDESPYLKNRSLLDHHLREVVVLKKASETKIGTHKTILKPSDDINKNYKSLKNIFGDDEENLDKLANDYWDNIVK